jgi:hypothetical protein
MGLLIPPLVGAARFALWRRANPDAARSAQVHRSRAAASAIRSLHTRRDDPARHVAETLLRYLHVRVGLSATATTPLEVAAELKDWPERLTADVADMLRRCDEARFAPDAAFGTSLGDDTERIILAWEGAA